MENCINWQERISAFLDGVLTEQERMELMEHLESCADCRAYFDDQMAIHGALTDLEAAAPAGFAEAVMERVRETAQDAPEKKVIAFPHWRRWAATAACCAVVLLGVLALVFAQFFGRNTPHYVIYVFSGSLLFSYFSECNKPVIVASKDTIEGKEYIDELVDYIGKGIKF